MASATARGRDREGAAGVNELGVKPPVVGTGATGPATAGSCAVGDELIVAGPSAMGAEAGPSTVTPLGADSGASTAGPAPVALSVEPVETLPLVLAGAVRRDVVSGALRTTRSVCAVGRTATATEPSAPQDATLNAYCVPSGLGEAVTLRAHR